MCGLVRWHPTSHRPRGLRSPHRHPRPGQSRRRPWTLAFHRTPSVSRTAKPRMPKPRMPRPRTVPNRLRPGHPPHRRSPGRAPLLKAAHHLYRRLPRRCPCRWPASRRHPRRAFPSPRRLPSFRPLPSPHPLRTLNSSRTGCRMDCRTDPGRPHLGYRRRATACRTPLRPAPHRRPTPHREPSPPCPTASAGRTSCGTGVPRRPAVGGGWSTRRPLERCTRGSPRPTPGAANSRLMPARRSPVATIVWP